MTYRVGFVKETYVLISSDYIIHFIISTSHFFFFVKRQRLFQALYLVDFWPEYITYFILPFGAQYEKESERSMSLSWYANSSSTSIELMTPKNISLYACYTTTMEIRSVVEGGIRGDQANQCRVKGRSSFCIGTYKKGVL